MEEIIFPSKHLYFKKKKKELKQIWIPMTEMWFQKPISVANAEGIIFLREELLEILCVYAKRICFSYCEAEDIKI